MIHTQLYPCAHCSCCVPVGAKTAATTWCSVSLLGTGSQLWPTSVLLTRVRNHLNLGFMWSTGASWANMGQPAATSADQDARNCTQSKYCRTSCSVNLTEVFVACWLLCQTIWIRAAMISRLVDDRKWNRSRPQTTFSSINSSIELQKICNFCQFYVIVNWIYWVFGFWSNKQKDRSISQENNPHIDW